MPMTDAEKLDWAQEHPDEFGSAFDAWAGDCRARNELQDFVARNGIWEKFVEQLVAGPYTKLWVADIVGTHLAAASEPPDAHDALDPVAEAAEHPEDHEGKDDDAQTPRR